MDLMDMKFSIFDAYLYLIDISTFSCLSIGMVHKASSVFAVDRVVR
ncbi:hypothetical protein PX699_01075 [Sphingobium sp. H39-3-25]|nr:hypothetical protein [Sphingobium arseniciresistens]